MVNVPSTLLFLYVTGEVGVKKEESSGPIIAAAKVQARSANASGTSTPTSTDTTSGTVTVSAATDIVNNKPLQRRSRDSAPRMQRRSFQRSSAAGIKPVDSVLGAMHELDKQEVS